MSPAGGQLRLSEPGGRGTLAAMVLGSGITFLDATVVNVALPAMGRDLHLGLTGLQWTVDAYLLALGALLLVGGALGDRYGRRRIYAWGLGLFCIASLGCGLARSEGVLVAARLLQGVGGALLVPGSLAILRAVLVEEDQGRAIGLWSGLAGISSALGPLVGGWLIGQLSWRWVFFVNVPLTAVALWLLWRDVPENHNPEAKGRLDLPGALLASLGLSGSVYALIEGPAHGWTLFTVALGILGALLLVAFVVAEAKSPHPMMPLGLFASRRFSGANLATLGIYFALGGTTFLLVLQLQEGLGYGPIAAGAALLPISVLMLVLSPIAGRSIPRIGHRLPMALGSAVIAVGLLLLARTVPGAGYWTVVFPGVVATGLGLSLMVAPLTDAAIGGAPAHLAGAASGVNNAAARIANLLAVALLPWASGISASGTGGLGAGFPRAMVISAVLCALGGAVAWVTQSAPPSAAASSAAS